MVRSLPTGVLILSALLTLVPAARGGVYSPHEPVPFKIRPDGTAEELAFGTQSGGPFRLEFQRRMNLLDANPARAKDNTDRQKVLDRIEAANKKPPSARSRPETAALAADLLRVGKPDEALNLLAPFSRDRQPDFRVLANLAHVYAFRGEWHEALSYHDLARDVDELPPDLAGTTPEQRRWLLKVERQYYPRWLLVHRQRSVTKAAPETEEVFPLFPIRFVNDAGAYEPGKLAAAEKAKLPPDAVAIVQQLLLWAPWDTALYWLLAELYAADGRLREAHLIFNQCADSRQYSNRDLFMAHRQAVREAVEKLPPEKLSDVLPPVDDEPPPTPDRSADFLPSRQQVIIGGAVFGVFVLALIALQVRSIARRLRGDCGPGG